MTKPKQEKIQVWGGIADTNIRYDGGTITMYASCDGVEINVDNTGFNVSPRVARELATQLILLSGVASTMKEYNED